MFVPWKALSADFLKSKYCLGGVVGGLLCRDPPGFQGKSWGLNPRVSGA